MKSWVKYLIFLAGILVILPLAACSQQSVASSNAAAPTTSAPAATATPAITESGAPVMTNEQLSNIQPGLGTVMIEYAMRFNNLWFAAQANNWDMASYQVKEMTEIQETGETTRPKRADALKSFESGFLDPLQDAIAKKDKAAFETAYDKAITGCNACHSSQTSADFPGGYKFVKITRPTTSDFNNVDWKGQ